MTEDDPLLYGKHWHPAIGWTYHGVAACRRAVADSENLRELRRLLERRRLQKAGK